LESYSYEIIRKNEKKAKEDRSLKQRQTSKEEGGIRLMFLRLPSHTKSLDQILS